MARSYSLTPINVQNKAHKSSKGKSNQSSEETLSFEQSRTFASERLILKSNKNKSLIFGSHHFQKEKEIKIKNQHTIKVYYFNLPTFKNIAFDSKTTIMDLINEAVDAYQQDNRLDLSRVKQKHHQSSCHNIQIIKCDWCLTTIVTRQT